MGYSPLFLTLRAAYRMVVEPPPVLGGLVLGAGFLAAQLTGKPRVNDPGAVAELRREQRARLQALFRGGDGVEAPPLPGGGPAFWS
jgi:hypothetical protein